MSTTAAGEANIATITFVRSWSAMIERPHPAILNREESLAHVRQHLSESVAFLTEVVNYRPI
jgi:hypothetical protein